MRIKDFMDQGGGLDGAPSDSELIKRAPGSGFETSGHARPTSIRTLAPKLLAPSAQQLPGGHRLELGADAEGREGPGGAVQPAPITRGSEGRGWHGCRAMEAGRGAKEGA